jgi:hypothetical protein
MVQQILDVGAFPPPLTKASDESDPMGSLQSIVEFSEEGIILRMAENPSIPADRAAYYRQLAVTIRAHIPVMHSTAARDELSALARGYEALARQAHEPQADKL